MWVFAYRWLVLGLILLASPRTLVAQDSKSQKSSGESSQKKDDAKDLPKDKLTVLKFWEMNEGLRTQLGATMIGAGNAHGVLGARMLASEYAVMSEWAFVFNEVLPLYFRDLERIEDRKPLPVIFQNQLQGPELSWYMAYNEALRRSHEATLDMFKASAEEHKHVVYADLNAMPSRYRGKVITVAGKLSVIRKKEAPRFVGEELRFVYTGFIIGPKGGPPYTVAFTELPADAEVSEKQNLEVTFHGYFLSLVRFPPDDKGGKAPDVISPYLVGKTLIVGDSKKGVLPPAADGPTSYSYYIIISVLGGIVAVAFILGGLNVWLRRGDRRIQAQLAEMRAKQNPFKVEPADPGQNVEPTTERPNGQNPPP